MANSKPNTGEAANQKENFLIRMGEAFTRVSQKYMPDPTIFAIALTLIAFILALILTDSTPMGVLTGWYSGLWELLTFSMQMSVAIITGAVVADAPLAQRGIRRIAAIAKTGPQAAVLVATVTILLSYMHFGLSLVGGALLARSIAADFRRRNIPFEYGLLVACAYIGQMTWCTGFSNSVGLTIATPGHFLESEIGIISLSQYIFNPMNLTLVAGFTIILPLFVYFLHPKGRNTNQVPDYALKVLESDVPEVKSAHQTAYATVGDRLNNSRIVCGYLGCMGLVYVVYAFTQKGFSALDLNMLNAIFLFSGLLLQGTVANYVAAFTKSTSSAAGIIFQFPLYAGIMGIIKYSGMVSILAEGMVAISSNFTFHLYTFLSASIVNMFVPSGGGQWAVQGPIAVESTRLMGVDMLKSIMAVAYGNSWTNMCQPFWALALLGFTGLKAKDIMGYSTAIMLIGGILFGFVILFLPA
ncbi:TIGR00366 family protein [Microvirga sp. W0021]|uniref:TIGR00366 family protein n=1 Tax=Hohaiivirga grylli TaxID=3133970 RepID=A0ABV0BGT7_9HYPH